MSYDYGYAKHLYVRYNRLLEIRDGIDVDSYIDVVKLNSEIDVLYSKLLLERDRWITDRFFDELSGNK